MPTDPMLPRDAGFTIRKLQETISAQTALIQQLQQGGGGQGGSGIDRLAQALSEQSARIEQFTRAVAHNRIAAGEDIPGPRLPRFYTVSISLASGSTATASGEAIITNDGPFKCYGIGAYWLPSADTGTDSSFTNRFLPVSTAQVVAGFAALSSAAASTDLGANLHDAVPDLSFKIEVAGSGRSWTPNVTEVPGGLLFGVTGYNTLIEPALVASGERIVVTAKPERSMPNTGTCRVVFQGYQILTNQPVRY